MYDYVFFFFSSRRRHTRFDCDWSSDVCSSDLAGERRELRGAGDLQMGRVAQPDRQGFPFLLELEQPLERPLPAPQCFVQLDEVHVIAREAAQRPLEGGAGIAVRADLRPDSDALAARPAA